MPSAEAVKLWVNNFEQSGTSKMRDGMEERNNRTPKNTGRVRERLKGAPPRVVTLKTGKNMKKNINYTY